MQQHCQISIVELRTVSCSELEQSLTTSAVVFEGGELARFLLMVRTTSSAVRSAVRMNSEGAMPPPALLSSLLGGFTGADEATPLLYVP